MQQQQQQQLRDQSQKEDDTPLFRRQRTNVTELRKLSSAAREQRIDRIMLSDREADARHRIRSEEQDAMSQYLIPYFALLADYRRQDSRTPSRSPSAVLGRFSPLVNRLAFRSALTSNGVSLAPTPLDSFIHTHQSFSTLHLSELAPQPQQQQHSQQHCHDPQQMNVLHSTPPRSSFSFVTPATPTVTMMTTIDADPRTSSSSSPPAPISVPLLRPIPLHLAGVKPVVGAAAAAGEGGTTTATAAVAPSRSSTPASSQALDSPANQSEPPPLLLTSRPGLGLPPSSPSSSCEYRSASLAEKAAPVLPAMTPPHQPGSCETTDGQDVAPPSHIDGGTVVREEVDGSGYQALHTAFVESNESFAEERDSDSQLSSEYFFSCCEADEEDEAEGDEASVAHGGAAPASRQLFTMSNEDQPSPGSANAPIAMRPPPEGMEAFPPVSPPVATSPQQSELISLFAPQHLSAPSQYPPLPIQQKQQQQQQQHQEPSSPSPSCQAVTASVSEEGYSPPPRPPQTVLLPTLLTSGQALAHAQALISEKRTAPSSSSSVAGALQGINGVPQQPAPVSYASTSPPRASRERSTQTSPPLWGTAQAERESTHGTPYASSPPSHDAMEKAKKSAKDIATETEVVGVVVEADGSAPPEKSLSRSPIPSHRHEQSRHMQGSSPSEPTEEVVEHDADGSVVQHRDRLKRWTGRVSWLLAQEVVHRAQLEAAEVGDREGYRIQREVQLPNGAGWSVLR